MTLVARPRYFSDAIGALLIIVVIAVTLCALILVAGER